MKTKQQQFQALEAKVTGVVNGEQSDLDYRAAVLIPADADTAVVRIQWKNTNETEWHGTPGSWYLQTLVESDYTGDEFSIDYGQKWSATGRREVIREALRICATRGWRIVR